MTASCDIAGWLGRAGDPLDGLDPNNCRDDRVLEAVIGLAEIFLHGLASSRPAICSVAVHRKTAAGDLDEPSALKFVLEQLALGLRALQYGVGVAERVGKSRIGNVVKPGWRYGRDVVSLGHGFTSGGLG
jgi:hypothetical protein